MAKAEGEDKLVTSGIERHTSLMRNEVRLDHIYQEHIARRRALDYYNIVDKDNRKQEFERIRANIPHETYYDRLYKLYASTCEGTGKWLLQDTAFTAW